MMDQPAAACFSSIATPRQLWQFAAMSTEPSLAADFPPVTEADWRKLVEAALKGAAFEKRLVSQTYDGLRVEPLYPRAAGVPAVVGRPAAPWQVVQRADNPDPKAAN